jgi:Spy/CpxP family protein refolding chaperone
MSFKLKNTAYKGMLAGLALAVCSPVAMASGWGDGGHDGHDGGAKKADKKDWDNQGGMESEGHMTMRLRMVWNLGLSERQAKKVREIQRELRAKHWALEDKIEDTSDQLFKLYSGARDPKKIGKVYSEIFDLRRQMIELGIEAGNRVEGILNPEQRKAMHKYMPKPKWGSSW